MGNLDIVYKSSVEQHEIDNLGHMNVQFYVLHSIQACELFFKKNNLIKWSQTLDSQMILDTINIRYLREQTLAIPFEISANFTNITNLKVEVFLEMINSITKGISATFLLKFKFDSNQNDISKLFLEVKENFSGKYISIPDHGRKKGLLSLPKLNLNYKEINQIPNALVSFCGLAFKKNCSEVNILNAADYMGVVSSGVPHLLLKGGHSIQETGIGGAAIEYEFRFNKFVKQGTGLLLKSGLRSIAEKTYIWTHWLIELGTNSLIATADSVIITMDLKSRKSVPIPEKMRVKLKDLLIKSIIKNS